MLILSANNGFTIDNMKPKSEHKYYSIALIK